MKKRFLIIFSGLILSFLSLISGHFVLAAEAGQQGKINKFGIHILEPSDLDKAQELVNSSGGDWGWVTVVIRDDDLNQEKWQNFMDQCREKHLIPLVRIATHNEGNFWVKPKIEDSQKWANFLSSLNWPTKDQYVILFNEPNHRQEWGGEINPKEYARIISEFSKKFKEQNPNFKILNAGLDLAAPNGKETMDAYRFLQEMKAEVPDVFEKLDGWSSHSYPNHGFVGHPWDTGRVSIKGYDWELWILKNHFGLKKDLPVFITETGWPSGTKFEFRQTRFGLRKVPITQYYDETTAAHYLKTAFETVWLNDPRIKAVTPFVLNYQSELFAAFSWFKSDGQPAPQYDLIKSIPKDSWWPPQVNKYEIKSILLPSFLPTETTYRGKLLIQNIGQSILGEREPFKLISQADTGISVSDLTLTNPKMIRPGEIAQIEFTLRSSSQSGEFEFSWGEMPKQKIKVLPSSIITSTKYSLWEKLILKIKEVI